MGWVACMVVSSLAGLVMASLLVRRDMRLGAGVAAVARATSPWLVLARYTACYGLYVVVLVLSVAAFFVWPGALKALLALLDLQWGLNRLIYLTTLTLLTLLLFIVVMGAEPYLRHGVERHLLLRRFLRLSAVVGSVAVVGLAIRWIAEIAL
jgi:hypothetical protein